MTGQLRVAFAPDMPAAAVEVVSPDMEVVDRFMLDAGGSHTVDVPSEASFLRVHLPSGKIVTLQDPGNLNREVSMGEILAGGGTGSRSRLPSMTAQAKSPAELAKVDPSEAPTYSELRRYHSVRSAAVPESVRPDTMLLLAQFGTAQLIGPDGAASAGYLASRNREAHWEVERQTRPYRLRLEQPSGSVLEVQVPGNARRVWARADMLRQQSTISFSIRIQTTSDAADTIAGYLQRGDLYSAEATAEWVDEALGLLQDRVEDPYAAAVGAYLLLRLRRFSQMRSWVRNLADWFPDLPDGCVLWASQLMQQPSSNPAEIQAYLLRAVQRGLPVYTEGLRLLTDGLRLISDKEGAEAREKVKAATGVVVWDSPVTAAVRTTSGYSRDRDLTDVVYDIAFAARA